MGVRIIESVHADDKPESNGDNADGSRDATPQPPRICRCGFDQIHLLSLHLAMRGSPIVRSVLDTQGPIRIERRRTPLGTWRVNWLDNVRAQGYDYQDLLGEAES